MLYKYVDLIILYIMYSSYSIFIINLLFWCFNSLFSFIIIPNYLYLFIRLSLYSLIIILNSYTYRRNLFISINELFIYLFVYYLCI